MHLFLSIAATLLIMMAFRGQAFLQAPQAVHFDFMILGSTVNDLFISDFRKEFKMLVLSFSNEAGSLKSGMLICDKGTPITSTSSMHEGCRSRFTASTRRGFFSLGMP